MTEKTSTAGPTPEQVVKTALHNQIAHVLSVEERKRDLERELNGVRTALEKSVAESKRLHAGLVALDSSVEADYEKFVREHKRVNHLG